MKKNNRGLALLGRGTGPIIALLALLAAACGSTGGITVDEEQQAGAEVSRQVEDQVGLYNDGYLKNYVDGVGRRLVSELNGTPYSFRFEVIDQAEPNAFASPGGYIYLSRGLLALINSEAELAGVLAHEISHVTLRHHARQAQRSMLPGILSVPGRVISAVVNEDLGQVINAPVDAAGRIYLSAYGRGQESEADLTGMRLAAAAGYDPMALADALDTLGLSIAELTGEQQKFSFFSSHPTTPTRVADIRRQAGSLSWQPTAAFAPTREALFKRLDGLIWGPGNPAQGLFQGQQFLQPDLDFTLRFPPGWRTINTPRFVGAVEPNQQALIVLGPAGPVAPPAAYAEAFAAELEKEAGAVPDENRALQLGNWPAQLVRIKDVSGAEPASIYYLWIQTERSMFLIIGAGFDRYTDMMADAVLSMRALTDAERDAITSQRLRIAIPTGNETLPTFSAREGNLWNPAFTAAVNGLKTEQVLPAGLPIKILREERY